VPATQKRLARNRFAWCVPARFIAEADEALRLVEREIMADAPAEVLGDDASKLRKQPRGLAVLPAAFVLQRLRRVPVEQRYPRRDAAFQQRSTTLS